LFSLVLKALHGCIVALKVNTGLFFKLVNKVVNNTVVEVFTTKVGVTVRALYFKYAVAKLKNRNVEGTNTKVESRDLFVFLAFKAVCKCSRSWLVNNTLYFEAGNFTSIFCRLPL